MSRARGRVTPCAADRAPWPMATQSEWGWRDRAACREVDPELFFPVGTDGPALAQIAQAKAVCARCPVIGQCLSFALAAISEGVAGGLSAEERRALRVRHRAVPASVPTSTSTAAVVTLPDGALLPGVDGLVVAALVAGQAVVGVSRAERAWAAVVLHRAGRSPGWIATRLRVADRQVRRWLECAQSGGPLNPRPGRSGKDAVA